MAHIKTNITKLEINNIDHRVSQCDFENQDLEFYPKLDIPIRDIENVKSFLLIH